MQSFLYYFDKWTAWLDFSWLVKKTVYANDDAAVNANDDAAENEPPRYSRFVDPLLSK